MKRYLKIFVFEELIFFIALIFWAYIRGSSPDLIGLEKYMDLGFLNSLLRTEYFPPKDMWLTPYPINYYYFGHLTTAVLTKLSQIPTFISYNLMLSTLFSLTFVSAFSIGINLFSKLKLTLKLKTIGSVFALILCFGGNLTTIYAFFKAYDPSKPPIPFWNLQFLPFNFPNEFWYPNATRFIPFTIHEFPIYSFVVSDLHGHVLDIPLVLLIISILLNIFLMQEFTKKTVYKSAKLTILGKIKSFNFIIFKHFGIKSNNLLIIGFLLSVMYMTNAWDGIIYSLLTFLVFYALNYFSKNNWGQALVYSLKSIVLILLGFATFSLPFSVNFKPFVSGIGIICAPKILTDIGRLGPILFESNHCQRSEFWQLILLYGSFYFFVIMFLLFKYKKFYKFKKIDVFILILIGLSTLLIIIPEFVYIKDIYPLHYRANTMFKLTYQAFIMLSISSVYILFNLLFNINSKLKKFIFILTFLPILFLTLIYPFFAINSFYSGIKNYKSQNGLKYMEKTYPKDYLLINWINSNIKGQPVILEANGDSYTEYARISVNTGLPTVIGWPVHEWLWRGTYDIVAPRIEDVKTLYTTSDVSIARVLIKKYNISYVVISDLEEKKYPNINKNKFDQLGKVIYKNSGVMLYQIID